MENAMNHKPIVVAIGGGTGLPAVLKGLKKYDCDLTAIVSVGDDGGSSGKLRRDFGVLPPGDIRNCFTALLDESQDGWQTVEQLLNYRFKSGEGLNGHTIGNLLFTALTEITGNFEESLHSISRFFPLQGRILPVSNHDIELAAELDNGMVISGECNIGEGMHNIKHLFMNPSDAPALPAAVEAIEKADHIIFGPGSLYTSVIANLLFGDIQNALQRSRAKTVYVCNIMTQPGETADFCLSDHLRVLQQYLPADMEIDYVLANNAGIDEETLALYYEQGASMVKNDIDNNPAGCKIIDCDLLMCDDSIVRHDHYKLAKALMNIISP